jgi:ElaA protein
MLHFICLPFDQLSLRQLYEIMACRQAVFSVEQKCFYLDADGKDLSAWHLMGMDSQGRIAAYARLLPKGVAYPNYQSLGRVLTMDFARGTGAGKALIGQALEEMERLFGKGPIKIAAQTYLIRFYGEFGFQEEGEEFLEDGIPHVHMIRKR